MKIISVRRIAVLAALLIMPASADAGSRAWVSSNGTGTSCTRAQPCATFDLAIAAVAEGGEISCVDAGDYSPITSVPKSVTIDCSDVGATISQLALAGNGIANFTANKTFTLRGVTLNGKGIALTGIDLEVPGVLNIENCRIAGFQGAYGVKVAPASGTATVSITDSMILDSGVSSSGNGGGVGIQPTGSGAATVVLSRVQLKSNRDGVDAFGDSTSASISLQVRDSVVAESTNIGVIALAGSAPLGVTLDAVQSVRNQFGVMASGANAFVTLGNTTVMANQTGVLAAAGGHFFSYGNNQLTGNATDLSAGTTLGGVALR